jgi:1,6-anhydro-N-acetylmuramate kinase
MAAPELRHQTNKERGRYAAADALLALTGTSPGAVRAIGCHGQTVRHRDLPPSENQKAPEGAFLLADRACSG